ncbi:trypsin-like serine protease [Actinoplanes rectilineatus]|uniref:trypsin-like serine protease n=1 Tax=Actinoplanes rectilineatus TaxID=113571 RepID=UPI000AE81A8D|nr:trypsin-like serine protease [Actinoplanes rectilineatus]
MRNRTILAGLTISAVAVGLAGSAPALAVVNGSAVADGTYGFVAHVAVGTPETGGQACTGALVDPQWVITAAACFAVDGQAPAAGKPSRPTTVTIGRADLSGTAGQVRTAARLVPHPSRDVVLVRLNQPTTVTPVALAATAPATGDLLRVAGYGRTATEWVPGRLHSAQFQVNTVGAGLLDVAGVTENQPGVCKGDAGGPALRETGGVTELVAINHASWQGGCIGVDETRRDATETRIDDLGSWIRTYAPGGLAEDHRDDVKMVYSYADGSVGPFTFTTAADGAMTARGGCRTAVGLYNVNRLKTFKGDFNGDGRIDQVVLNGVADAQTLTLDTFLTNADGTCSAGVRSWTSTTFGTYERLLMTSGDYNGDGRTDLAGFYNYANASIGLFTWIARADGTFGSPTRSWFNDATPYWGEIARMKVFSGDFNGDGRDDVGSFYKYADNSVGIYSWTSTAAGGFGEDARVWSVPASPYWGDPDRLRIAAGDFNGDGRGDVAGFYNYASGELAMLTWTAKADGTFNSPFSSYKSTTSGWGSWDRTRFTSGDFNGDGRDDLAALYGYADGSLGLHTLVANEQGGFASPVRSWTSATFGSYASINLAEDPV